MSARLSVRVAGVLCVLVGVLVFGSVPAFAAKEYVGVGSFGGEGSGNGQFKEPSGVAVDQSSESLLQPAAGDVYVIDAGNQRVERFDSAGSYLSQWDGSATVAKSFSFSAVAESQGIAVDSSTSVLDPSAGDVYVADVGNKVVDQFGSTGGFTGLELTGTCASPGTCSGKAIPFPGELLGVAVDPSGNLWVYEREANVDEFSDTGAFVQSFNTNRGANPGLAVDAGDNIYPVFGNYQTGKYEGGLTVSGDFGRIETEKTVTGLTSLTANPVSGEVLLDQGSAIERFEAVTVAEPQPVETFATEGLTESYGIAVDGTSNEHTAYASQRGADTVEMFNFSGVHASISNVSETGMTLEGTVLREGEVVVACRFEYGTTKSYGQSVVCEQTPEEINKAGETVALSAKLSGLPPAAARHIRLLVTTSNDTNYSKDASISRPQVENQTASNINATEATVSAGINAEMESTSYRVEYGTSESYGFNTTEIVIGAPAGPASVRTQLSGLQPGAEYHFRFTAINKLGATIAGAMTFTTAPSFARTALTLPDNRAYELVSPPEDSEVLIPRTDQPETDGPGGYFLGPFFRASSVGDAVTFDAEPPPSGVTGSGHGNLQGGDQYLARRGVDGWAASDIAPPSADAQPLFEAASPDLSVLTFHASASFAAEPAPPTSCSNGVPTYSYTSSGYHALITESASPGECFASEKAGISADGAHVLLYSSSAFTSQAATGATSEENNLYDSFGGRLYQVNVLPNGRPEDHPDALYGHQAIRGNNGNPNQFDFQGVVSPDGSRIFWTDLNREVTPEDPAGTTRLFVRENDARPQSPLGPKGECTIAADACTVQVDAAQGGPGAGGGGQFWLANGDGSRVFFTDESQLTAGSTAGPGEPDLYEYDLDTGRLSDLTVARAGSHAGVQGLVGASEDGSYVYFVADGVLAQGANAQGKEAVAGQPNLYLSHGGATTFIVTLSSGDDNIYPSMYQEHEHGDWVVEPGERTAQVSSNGQAVVFMSRLALTGYDSYGSTGGSRALGAEFEDLPEVFVYEAGTGRLSCASCSSSGNPPASSTYIWEDEYNSYVPWAGTGTSVGVTSPLRFMNATGTRVFFLTNQPLVSQDTNSYQDVYEWENDGSGGCAQAGGCVAPISSVGSPGAAFFVDASVSGDDVFFEQRTSLVPLARDETVKLYDARVNGGFPETSLGCSGTGCQGVPPAPPIFATPASTTFSGVGNFEAPATGRKATPKRKSAARLRSEKLTKALRICRRRYGQGKARRGVCEKQARQLYGTAKKRGKR
ncbi:MAG: fibronectin type III domain-containing protein [Solirubrobacteraceae bacterium]